MSTTAGAAGALLTLGGAGALPVVALVGLRWPTLVLAPLLGAVLAAGAVMAELALGGGLLGWFVALAVAAAAAAGLWWWRRPDRRPWRRPATGPGPRGANGWPARLTGLVGAAVVAVAVVWSLRPLRTSRFGFDARAIYLLHAHWYAGGHQVALHAVRNPVLLFSQQTYPPLASASVAVSWLATGNGTDRLGVVVLALLNACAVAACAWAVVEVGRTCAGAGGAGAGRAGAGWRALPLVAGVAAAGLLAIAAFGIAGPYATNGYTDLLWSACGLGAVGFGFFLTGRGSDLGAAAVLLAAAGLTKNEAVLTSMVAVALLVLREIRRRRTSGDPRPWWRPVLAGVAGVAGLALWPVVSRAVGATQPTGGPHPGSFGSRLRDTWDGLLPHLHPVGVALVVAVLGALLLARTRRRAGVGNDLWAWAVLATYLVALGAVYVRTTGTVAFRLLTSVDRTTVFAGLAGWLIVAVWAVVGAAAPLVALDPGAGSDAPPGGAAGPTGSADEGAGDGYPASAGADDEPPGAAEAVGAGAGGGTGDPSGPPEPVSGVAAASAR